MSTPKTSQADMAHSKVVGSSSAGRRLQCPGSQHAEAQMPNESSDYAKEGTLLHAGIEFMLDRDDPNELSPDDLLGLSFDVGGEQWTITADQIATAIAPSIEYFDKVVSKPGLDYIVEQTLPFPGIPGGFGTGDILYFDEKNRSVGYIDWKMGVGVPVQSKNNPQGLFTLTAMIDYFDLWDTIDRATVHMVQPRLGGFDPWTVPVAQLRIFEKQLQKALHGPKFLRTGKYCKFCAAASVCPERQKEVADALAWKKLGPDLPDPDLLANLEDWLRQAKGAIYKSLEAGGKVDGWKMVRGRNSRHWAVDDANVEEYLEQAGFKADDFAPRKLASVAQAETLFKAVKERLDKDMVIKVEGGLTIAPEDDKRDAVPMGPRDLSELAQFLGGKNNG